MSLLRVAAVGSVDDGKSTLIGRLLFDTRSLFTDQLAELRTASKSRGGEEFDLALVTDGLKAEREQGITIDVAYRYFTSSARSIVLADTPGHVQYTRNMITGASTADVAVLLVDAGQGVVEQTRRHCALITLLRVSRLVVAVNKMDAVDFDAAVFRSILSEVSTVVADAANALGTAPPSVTAIPVSALRGDNVVRVGDSMPWYEGPSLLDELDSVAIAEPVAAPLRFPVQRVVRFADGRGYAGTVSRGELRVGQPLMVAPGGAVATVTGLGTVDGPLDVAEQGRAVVVRLAEHVDVARGDFLVAGDEPLQGRSIDAWLCVVAERALRAGARVVVRFGSAALPAVIVEVSARLDVATVATVPAGELGSNDIGVVTLRLAGTGVFDTYQECRQTGAFIVVCPTTGATIAGGMVRNVTV